MSNSTIKLKSSTTAGNVPSSLETGEFAINVEDGNLFYGSASAVKQDLVLETLTVKGSLTAENYIVSSSVTHMTQSFSSGSTIFGDTQDDTHQFTGSINVTGSISATSFTGDGSGLTGLPAAAITTYSSPSNNRVITSVTSTEVEGEQFLTYTNQGGLVVNNAASGVVDTGITVHGNIFGSGSHIRLRNPEGGGGSGFYLSSSGDLAGGNFKIFTGDIDGVGNSTLLTVDDANEQITTSKTLGVTGNITVTGTVDGRDVATDGTKLDTIETNADVTDATNVAANLPSGTVSGSSQVNANTITNFDNNVKTKLDADSVVSQSGNFINNEFIVAVGANAVTSSDALAVDSSGNLGIGTPNPEVRLHMLGEAPQTTQILMEQFNDTADAPDIRTRRYRGTSASRADVQTGDYLFRLNVHGQDDGTSELYGSMRFDVDGSDQDAMIWGLQTRDTGGTVADRITIDSSGDVDIAGNLSINGFADVSASLAAAVAGGDDLGNHTATQDLNMGGNAITNVGNVDGVDVSTLNSTVSTNTSNITTLTAATSSYSTATGVENNADVTDTANVTSAGALMDSEVTNLAQVKAFDSSDYATAAQGTKADTAIQPADTGSFSTATGVEDNADVTDATNVQAAGALMDSEITNLSQVKSFDSSDYATAAQGTKADTAIQPADTGSFSTATGVENNADVTDTANVTSAGALMDSEITNLAQVKAFDSSDYATAAQGALADSAQQPPSEGAFANGDKTKLDGIEASADITDTANVTSAGALMDSEVTNLAQVKAFDSSDYATSAQGTKADSAQQPPSEGAFANGDKTKLDGIEASADVTDTANVQSSLLNQSLNLGSGTLFAGRIHPNGSGGPYIDEVSNRIQVSSGFKATTEIVAGTHITASSNMSVLGTLSLPGFTDVSASLAAAVAGGDNLGNHTATQDLNMGGNAITSVGNVDGRDISTDGTKLDGIEASADVTDTANVTSAGALMDSELTNLAAVKAINQGLTTTSNVTFASIVGDNVKASGENANALRILDFDGDGFIQFDGKLSTSNAVITIGDPDDGGNSTKIKLTDADRSIQLGTNSNTHVTASGNISASGTITGNSIVGTLATAAQTNITSVGTLGSLTMGGDIDMDGQTIDTNGGQIDNAVEISSNAFKMGNGSVSTPALAFTSDTNTGIYAINVDTLGIVAGGSINFSAGSTNNSFSKPLSLSVSDGDGAILSVTNTYSGTTTADSYAIKGVGNAVIGIPGSQNKAYGGHFTAGNTNAANPDTIALFAQGHEDGAPNSYAAIFSGSAGGVVGINTMEPTVELDVSGDGKFSGALEIGGISDVSASIAAAGGGGGSDNLGNHTATQDLDLNSNNIKGITHITASGNISASGIIVPQYDTKVSTFFTSDANGDLIPMGGTLNETTTPQYYINYMSPYGGQLIRAYVMTTSSSTGAFTLSLRRYTAFSTFTTIATATGTINSSYTPTLATFSAHTISAGDWLAIHFDPTGTPSGVNVTSLWRMDSI